MTKVRPCSAHALPRALPHALPHAKTHLQDQVRWYDWYKRTWTEEKHPGSNVISIRGDAYEWKDKCFNPSNYWSAFSQIGESIDFDVDNVSWGSLTFKEWTSEVQPDSEMIRIDDMIYRWNPKSTTPSLLAGIGHALDKTLINFHMTLNF